MAETLLTIIKPAASGEIGFSTIFLLILFFILTITAIHVYFKTQESYKLAIEIPGPDPIPILGNALLALGKTPNGKFFKSLIYSVRKVNFFLRKLFFVSFWWNFDRNFGRVFTTGWFIWTCGKRIFGLQSGCLFNWSTRCWSYSQ